MKLSALRTVASANYGEERQVPHIGVYEDEHHEFKQEWTSRALENLSAFANYRD
jgi:hypothetical protein